MNDLVSYIFRNMDATDKHLVRIYKALVHQNKFNKAKNMVSTGVGLIAVASALTILSNVLSSMGNFTWEEIAKGLVTMGGALAELSIALNLMNGTLAGSAALLIASASLAVLAPVLSILGAMSWEAIAKGLVSLAGAFAIIGVAGAVLSPIIH